MPDPTAPLTPSRGGVWAPPGVYLRLDDNIRVTSYNAAANVVLATRARMYTVAGAVEDSNDSQTPNTDRTAKQSIVRTDEGWLLGGEVFASSGSPLLGQCLVVVEVVKGESTAAIATQLLAAGYVTAKQPLIIPQLQPQSSLDGGGALRSVTGTDPAAGSEISDTVPTGARWRVLVAAATLVTSAVVANRQVDWIVDDGTTTLYRFGDAQNHAASTTRIHELAPGAGTPTFGASAASLAGAPTEITLLAGWRLRTVTALLDTGDNWGAPQYLVREWIEGS